MNGSFAPFLIHDNNSTEYFNREDYETAFKNFLEICVPVFDALPDSDYALDDLAARGMEELEQCWSSLFFLKRNGARSSDRLMFCTFFAPAAKKHSERACKLAVLMREKWITAYPGEPFELLDYDTIIKGFERDTILGFKIR